MDSSTRKLCQSPGPLALASSPLSLPLRCVIFDCDGVLIDSEPITERVTAAAISELGWTITPAEAHRLFLGVSLPDMRPMIEARIGRCLPEDWYRQLSRRLADTMSQEVQIMPGAREAIAAAEALGLDWQVASNSSRVELAAKLRRTGLADASRGRVHSVDDVIAEGGRGKPAPDLFLRAANAAGAKPQECVVVEDSVPGVRGARSAGMPCLGFSPTGEHSALEAAGAVPFSAMSELPALLRAILETRP